MHNLSKARYSKNPLHGGLKGRKRVREAAERLDDDVHKRLKLLDNEIEFKYHNNYACYKKYTDVRIQTICDQGSLFEEETGFEKGISTDFEPHKPSTRSYISPRAAPSNKNDSMDIDCSIYGSYRVWNKAKYF